MDYYCYYTFQIYDDNFYDNTYVENKGEYEDEMKIICSQYKLSHNKKMNLMNIYFIIYWLMQYNINKKIINTILLDFNDKYPKTTFSILLPYNFNTYIQNYHKR